MKVISSTKKYASMQIRVRKADGTVISLGKVSNLPIIGWLQGRLVNWRIQRYRKQMEAQHGIA